MEYQGCNKCKYEKTDRYSYPCSFCVHNAEEHFQPKTNADRIRNMTDGELAEFLVKVNCSYSEPCMTGETDCRWEDYPTHDKGCKDCFLECLQSEVKEGNSNENT